MQPDITIPDDAKQLSVEAEQTLAIVKDCRITSAEGFAQAGEQLRTIKAQAKALEKRRKEITQPIDAAKKSVMDFFRKPLDFLSQAERAIKTGMATYQREEEKRLREEQRKAEEAARKEAARLARRAEKAAEKGQEEKAAALQMQSETVQTPVVAFTKPKAAGVSFRKTWRADVVDLPALLRAVADGKAPAKLVQPNMTELNKIARALGEDMNFPGVRAVPEDVVSARTA